jgi:NADP-dependent 3-hydroxy acid dehydrogenase YdfG
MEGSLKDSVVLVTGVTGNVGHGMASAAQQAGARVVLPVRSAQAKAEVEREFGGTGRALVSVVDFGVAAELNQLVGQAVQQFGAIHHVMAPMGAWWQKGPSLQQPAAELRSLLSTYVEAQFALLSAVAPALSSTRGSYTLVTGAAGEGYLPGAGLLVVAVGAQYALSSTLRAETAQQPFRLNELRIFCRIEREARPGVVTATVAGRDFLAILQGDVRGQVFRYRGVNALSHA